MNTRVFMELVKRKAGTFKKGTCSLCPLPIMGNQPMETYQVNGKTVTVHSDCYWAEISRGIEDNPIHIPGMPVKACA